MQTTAQLLSLSPTRIENANCPYRFRALYRLGIHEDAAPELLVGREVHRVAAAYVELLRDTRRQTAMEYLGNFTDGHWAERDPRIPEGLRDDFDALCRHLLDWLPDPETLVGSEVRL